MSLLLDALKKAAEQKAQKSKSEAVENRPSDETVFDAEAAQGAAQRPADESPRSRAEDETQLEQTELQQRLSRGDRIAGDDTNLEVPQVTETVIMEEVAEVEETAVEVPDTTETVIESSRSDETVFDQAAMEMAEVTETVMMSEQEQADEPDDTNVEVGEVTRTEIAEPQIEASVADDTNVDIAEVTETVLSQPAPIDDEVDETGVDVPDVTETLSGEEQSAETVDEDATGVDTTEASAIEATAIGEPGRAADDETIVSAAGDLDSISSDSALGTRRPEQREDETDINHVSVASADQIESGASADDHADSAPAEIVAESSQGDSLLGDDDDTARRIDEDEDNPDLSLLLVEPDPTTTGMTTGYTDPQIPADRARVLEQGDADLALKADRTERRTDEQTDTQGPTLTNPTATAVYGDDTLAAPTKSTITRADTTSTHTYAPDNYDRTLMKLPSDDASKLFAGMKSDSDVVMTPDYAKKVFRSKTSAQRTRHYQTYAGIALILLLAVGIFGVLEYQDESELIDSSLRPLKRDPLPQGIKIEPEPEVNLFDVAKAQADARTIEIIATAEDPVEPEDLVESTESESPATIDEGTEAEPVAGDAEVAMLDTIEAPVEQAPEQIPARPVEVATTDQPSNSRLEIKTSSQYRQLDVWLREAYDAYQAGNDTLAMQRYNQVLEVDPRNRNALLARAAINVQNNAIDAAIRDYQALLLANPKDSLAMSSLLSVANVSPGEAESQLKLMLQEEPNSPYLNFALANAYSSQGRWQEAQNHYFEALSNNPGDPNYAYNLAVSLEHISQPRTAITYYQRALDNFGNGLATFSREVVDQRMDVLGKL